MPMSAARLAGPRKEVTYTDDEIAALAAYVATLGTGPSIPDAEMYDPDTLSGDEYDEYVTRGGQIFLTNCTASTTSKAPAAPCRVASTRRRIRGVDPKHIYEAMLTGPQSMDTFSDGNIPPDDKKAVIAYLDTLNEQPNYGGFTLGSLGPVSEGLIAWLIGMGALVGFAVWIAAQTTRTTKKKDGADA